MREKRRGRTPLFGLSEKKRLYPAFLSIGRKNEMSSKLLKYIGLSVCALCAVAAMALLPLPGVDAQGQADQTLLNLYRRVEKLEQENNEDYRAIKDLFNRVGALEREIAQIKGQTREQINQLKSENQALRRRVEEEAREKGEGRTYSGYPRLRAIERDQQGNMILDFAK